MNKICKLNIDLYVIAAGKGSRMGGSIPKALVPIYNGEPNLTTLLRQIGSKFKNVYVVTNVEIQTAWDTYMDALDPALKRNVHNVPIVSGLGDGHAVMHGFAQTTQAPHESLDRFNANKIEPSTANHVVVCWGDIFIPDPKIVDEMLSKFENAPEGIGGVFPAVHEKNPYVTLTTTGSADDVLVCTGAAFSKWGEVYDEGYHDQSIFMFDKNIVWHALGTAYDVFWKNGKFQTPGHELSLLHTFHVMLNSHEAAIVYPTAHPTMSFNTIEEVLEIQKEIIEKWNAQS